MISLRSLTFLATWACFITTDIPALRAQAPADPIQEYIAERDKLDQDVVAKLEAVVKTIDAELAAQRLTPEQAQLQRQRTTDLRTRLDSLTDFEIKVSEKEVGTAAPALSKAWEEFRAALNAREPSRAKKLSQAQEAVIQRALEAWRKAEREEDLSAPLEMLRQAEQTLAGGEPRPQRPGFAPPTAYMGRPGQSIPGNMGSLQEASRLLAASQRFLTAFASSNPQAVAESFNQLGPQGSGQWARVVNLAETEQWRQRFVEKATAEVTSLRTEADALVAKSAGSKEIHAIAEKLEPVVQRAQQMKRQNLFPSANQRDFLRGWARALEQMEAGDWSNLQRELEAAGPLPDWFSAAGRKGFYTKVKEAEAEKLAAEKAARTKIEQEIRDRIAKVADGPSALALAEELPIKPQAGNDGTREPLMALQGDLRRLAAAWNAQSGESFSQELLRDSGTPHPWQGDLRELRSKILREYLARKTNSPELLAPPLNALPPSSAVRKLGAALKEKKEWMRLHDLLASTDPSFGGRDWQQNEELRGMKAFLTGQNFERAEQFGEAAQSYRMVMSCIGELVPVEAAAERLKAIAREHPEALSSTPARAASPFQR